MVPKRKSFVLKTFYFFCIVLMGFYCFKRPYYNWDMLPYSALILKMDHYNTQEAHTLTYKLVRENIPDKNYRQLTDSSHAYRNSMLNNAGAFNGQLPFYVVKPLYTGFSWVFYKLGISLPQATLIPSFISYLLIGLLLFHWLSIYLGLPITFGVASLIMISAPAISVASTASPDCLSAFFLLGSFYFIIEKPSLWSAIILMVLSVFTRLDNIVTCFLLLCIISFSGKWFKKISFRNFLFITILFIFCYFLIGLIAKQYGWSIFFYNDFADRLHPTYGSKEHFSFESYFRLMYEHVVSGVNTSYLAIFIALLFLSFNKTFSFKESAFEQVFSLSIPFILFIRFILYPDISDRFYIAFYLVIIILLVKRINSPAKNSRITT
jgi:hypothetical protein